MHRLILASILLAAVSGQYLASAQEAENSIGRLREQVAKLESMDRDGGLPENIHVINRDMLAERRTRLRTMIEQRIGALLKYRSEVASMLSPAESQVLEKSIRELDAELRNLSGQGSGQVDAALGSSEASARSVQNILPINNASFVAQGTPATTANKKSNDGDSESDVTTIVVDNDFETTTKTPIDPNQLFKFNQSSPISDADASTLIDETVGNKQAHLEKPDPFVEGDYCIIHAVQWKEIKDVEKDKPDVKHDLWLLYQLTKNADPAKGPTPLAWKKLKDFDGKRIYGSKRVAVLLVHMRVLINTDQVKDNTGTFQTVLVRKAGSGSLVPTWDISYKVAINKKTPAPFKHAIDLIGALSPTGGGRSAAGVAYTGDFWGGQMLDVGDVPSDIVVSASIAIEGQQNKEFTRTYDNEGKYHWDVSIGLPVKSFRELQFNSDGNKVTATAKERQDVYGFFNVYPVAVDVKANDYLTFPHLVFGVPLASKPLHHPFLGIGTGVYKAPIKFNIFAGVTFNRERVPRTLQEGQSATTSQLEADLQTRWVRKFTFGINLPVSQIKDAIKK